MSFPWQGNDDLAAVVGRRRRRGNGVTFFKYTPDVTVGSLGGTFTRADASTCATYIDQNGVVQTVAANVLRDSHYIGGVRCTLLEGSRVNVCLWNRDLTNAAWVKSNVTAALDQVGIDGAANSASSIVATAGNGTVLQAITLAQSTRNQSAYVKRITGSGTINMTTDGGTTWNVITVTGAWTQVTFSQTLVTNPSVGFRIVTNGDKIAVDYVQNETGAFQSSVVATTTGAVTRASDVGLIFPFLPIPQASTWYMKGIELGTGLTAGSSGLWGIGNSTNAALFCLNNGSNVYRATHRRGADTSSTQGAGDAYGNTLELRTTLDGTGVVQLGQSVNAAAETVATAGGANAFAATWNTTTLTLNSRDDAYTTVGFFALQKFVVAAGSQSLAVMRGL